MCHRDESNVWLYGCYDTLDVGCRDVGKRKVPIDIFGISAILLLLLLDMVATYSTLSSAVIAGAKFVQGETSPILQRFRHIDLCRTCVTIQFNRKIFIVPPSNAYYEADGNWSHHVGFLYDDIVSIPDHCQQYLVSNSR